MDLHQAWGRIDRIFDSSERHKLDGRDPSLVRLVADASVAFVAGAVDPV